MYANVQIVVAIIYRGLRIKAQKKDLEKWNFEILFCLSYWYIQSLEKEINIDKNRDIEK